MIQDIFPNRFDITYKNADPGVNSIVLCFDAQSVLVSTGETGKSFPSFPEMQGAGCNGGTYTYLFTIDDTEFFLYRGDDTPLLDGYAFESVNLFRSADAMLKALRFAGMTANHIAKWYSANVYCGRCGSALHDSEKERMRKCPNCGNEIYPKIAPAVIIGIYDGDRLLMSKYAGRGTTNYALIAGFVEAGETPEDAACREAFEEAGIRIKNLRYFGSQPWAYSESLLLGFYAELDGDSTIVLDENELAEASWIRRDEIDVTNNDFSLTNEMICRFQENRMF